MKGEFMPSQFVRERTPLEADYFVALDMDGTLLKSHELTPLVAEYFIHDEALRQRSIEAIERQRGKDFDSFTYLAGVSGIDLELIDTDALVSNLVEENNLDDLRSRLLMPGADAISRSLRRHDIPHGVLTKGGRIFQTFKLDLLRYLIDEPYLAAMITGVDAKSRYIEEQWWDESSERFVIPRELAPDRPVHAKNVMMVDDKHTHLVSDHRHLHGYHIDTLTVEDLIVDLEQGRLGLTSKSTLPID